MGKSVRRLLAASLTLALAACAGVASMAPPVSVPDADGWAAAPASTRPVGLGLPGGAVLAEGVTFVGGLELVADAASPLHGLSDLKATPEGMLSVTDAGDLVRFRIAFDAEGAPSGIEGIGVRRLTQRDGSPIADKVSGDAEGLAITPDGDLLISFERDHRIWNYGRPPRLSNPRPVTRPDFAFPENDGMEGLAISVTGWVVAGESGGVWDCAAQGCRLVTPPPATPLANSDFRITAMDRDPYGPGYFVIQRTFALPAGPRAQVRRMNPAGMLGPVLIELKLPGTTDNFEGVAAVKHGDGTRLFLLSDDNANPWQKTLLMVFDVAN